MRLLAAVLAVVILMAGCSATEIPAGMQCARDSDCAVGGCSGELCGAKGEIENITTACVFLQKYKCLKLSSCGCSNGMCQWDRNKKYNECIEEN
jgi:eight-cysteine-cluster-containing protein